MIELAEVRIWNKQVGAVLWDNAKNFASFEYNKSFLNLDLNLSPIMMSLEEALQSDRVFNFSHLNIETFHGLPGMLSDSLPDRYGTKLLDKWLSEQGRNADEVNPVERLCYTGKRGMGALEYEPAQKEIKSKTKSIEIDRLVRLASDVLTDKKELSINMNDFNQDDLMELIQVGTSAGGARAKAVIAYNKSTGDIKSGQIDNLNEYDYWIMKLDGVTNKQLGDPEGYGRIEFAYYCMAVDCKILMSECDLKKEGNRAHFMTKRFDRESGEKIHMQSLCGIAHLDYNQPGLYSYEQAFQVLRKLNLPYTDSVQLFRRMCFNVVARNQDDHTKNISFLMGKDGIWKLSPAYDVTYAYNPANKWLRQHQMSINGKRENVTRNDIVQVALNMNIKKPHDIINEIIEVVTNWTAYAKRAELDSTISKSIQKTLALNL